MAVALLCLLGLANCVLFALGQATGSFIAPPPQQSDTADPRDNAVYSIGAEMAISWATNASSVSLAIWQSNDDSGEADVGDLQYLPDSSKGGLFFVFCAKG